MVPRVAVQGLAKVFARRSATRNRGISTEGPLALKHLLTEMFTSPAAREVPTVSGKGRLAALSGVTFEVAPGEVVGIIGRNGAGKSTLLKILARVLHPTAGRVTIRGRVVSMLELGVGFAPDLTVRQNIQIHGRLAGIPARRVREAEDAILQFSGLAAQADVPLGTCPGGSGVQLGFAAVICLGAEVILADEVLAVGDSAFRQGCEERVRTAGTSGESVLFVSHDMAAIQRVCTRVIWIDRGRIVRDGPTTDVVDAYTSELLTGHLLSPVTREGLEGSCLLLDTRLLDAGHAQVGALQLTEPGYIDCLFRVLRSDVSVVVEINVWCGRILVFSSSSEPIDAEEGATFRAGIRIPQDFLNELPYRSDVRLLVSGQRNGKLETVVSAEGRLEFSAMNPHPERSVWNGWTLSRGGFISPRLPWRIDPVAPPSADEAGRGAGAVQ